MSRGRALPALLSILPALLLTLRPAAASSVSPDTPEIARKSAELQIHNLIEPVLDKYCRDQCKLMSITPQVEMNPPEKFAPGFDDTEGPGAERLVPTEAKVKILIDEQVGPVSRSKLLNLLQQYVDTLDYPVKMDVETAHFPTAATAVGKTMDMRERVLKRFQSTIDDLFSQFCPKQCMLADVNLATDVVNGEEAQYGTMGEFVQDGDVAIKIRNLSGTLLMDEELGELERANLLEMARLKTNFYKNVTLTAKALKFPKGLQQVGTNGFVEGNQKDLTSKLQSSSNATTSNKNDTTHSDQSTRSSSEVNSKNDAQVNSSKHDLQENRQERFEHYEKVERVESGDAVQAQLQKLKYYGIIFACSVLCLLVFIALSLFRARSPAMLQPAQQARGEQLPPPPPPAMDRRSPSEGQPSPAERVAIRYEIERLTEELVQVYAQTPKVAKQVFSRILTEEGIEATSHYIHIFGEAIVVDMLHDPSLQTDMAELLEFYAKNPIEIDDEEKLNLLKKLHNRTVAGKLIVLGNRSTHLFDFLTDMDGLQILELVRNESLTVKSIVLTQCDPQKRGAIYQQLDETTQMKLLGELSRIDYLPRDYICNVAHALKRKRRENPQLNTEALPGSEVLINLLEKTDPETQRGVLASLESANPQSARAVKSKLVCLDTLKYLRDGQLLEVVLNLKHDELLQFLKGTQESIRQAIFDRSPSELVIDLKDELAQVSLISREVYQTVERKVINRMKVMAKEGLINLVETNERMFMGATAVLHGSLPPESQPIHGLVNPSELKAVGE